MEQEPGASPGTLLCTGTLQKEVTGQLFQYDSNTLTVSHFGEDLAEFSKETDTAWLLVNGIRNPDAVRQIGTAFDLHILIQEHIVTSGLRTRVEDYDNLLYFALSLVHQVGEGWETRQFSLVLMPEWVLVFTEEESDLLDPIKKRLKRVGSVLRSRGADYLAYAVIDLLIDRMQHLADALDEDVEEMENNLIQSDEISLDQWKSLHEKTLMLKRNLRPYKEMLLMIQKDDIPMVSEEAKIYFRDVYDHTVRCLEQVDALQETLNGYLNFYNSQMSLKLNEVMKFLTMIGTIFIPLTFIVGIYGMNFESMPELRWQYGYPMIWFLMVVVLISTLVYFKLRKWL